MSNIPVRKLRVKTAPTATAPEKVKVKPKAPKAEITEAKPTPKLRVNARAPVLQHDATKYTVVGASGPVRSSRNLSPVVLDRVPDTFTQRDQKFLIELYAENKTAAFERRNFDAGLMSRLVGHGYLSHKGGALDEPTAKFAITAKAVTERLQKA